MNRFQIEDIVEQDKHGVVFRARDEESGRMVSLRRFLPFGQDGGGLEKDEAVAFGIAAERLAGISHESLRSVIMGSVDAIDGIPYLVTEWVEGTPLNELLAGESMDPALVIDVLRIALEVSIVLSEVLGEEAVWVETEVESIIIGTKDSGRGFTFWISPFKWLGAQFGSRKLSSIVELGEKLTGWKGKAVSDGSGYGLGGWLKWLKKNPDASLGEALEMMASSIGKETPLPAAAPIGTEVVIKAPRIAGASGRKPVIIAAAATFLLLVSATLFYFQRIAKQPQIAAEYTGRESAAAPAAGSSQSPSRSLSAAERANARAKELQLEAARASITPAAAKEPRKTAPVLAGEIRNITLADKQLLMNMEEGTPLLLSGTLREVLPSGTGKSIYLHLSTPPATDKVAAVVRNSGFKGTFKVESFTSLIGKKIAIRGTRNKESGSRVFVKVHEQGHIEVVE